MPLLQASLPYCSTDKVFSAIFFSFSQLVTGWRDGRISFYCAPLLTRPPERAKTRSSPKRAHSDRARSASKEAGRPSHMPASHDHLSNSYLFHTPRLAGRSSPLLRASNEGLPRPRVPRARRALLIASHSHHTPYQSNIAPPHRRREYLVQAVCRHRQLNR